MAPLSLLSSHEKTLPAYDGYIILVKLFVLSFGKKLIYSLEW